MIIVSDIANIISHDEGDEMRNAAKPVWKLMQSRSTSRLYFFFFFFNGTMGNFPMASLLQKLYIYSRL